MFRKSVFNFGKRSISSRTAIFAASSIVTSLVIEESYYPRKPTKRVTRYDTAQLQSNSPIEDTMSEKIIPSYQSPEDDWFFWGIFDGHAGYDASRKLESSLIDYVVSELSLLYHKNQPASSEIDEAIKSGFIKLDNDMVYEGLKKVLATTDKSKIRDILGPATSGSCALLSFYDPASNVLKTALTGDSRAVLGTYENGEWVAEPLSVDQTGDSEQEIERVNKEHPGESGIFKGGRILGLMVTRAFGDARFKWSLDTDLKVKELFYGYNTVQKAETNDSAPYVTAEPVISTRTIDPAKNKFLVLASDGLYDLLTNEQVIGLVAKWVEYQDSKDFSRLDKSLTPVKDGPTVGRAPEEIATFGDVILEDSNVASHLIRNALSQGKSYEHAEMMAGIPLGLSRNYRDDISVTVVFFGDS